MVKLLIYYWIIVRFSIGLDFVTFFSISSCHGHILCQSQVLPCSLLHSLTMFFMVVQPIFCIQLFTPYISSPSPSSSFVLITCPYHLSIPLLMTVVIGSTNFLNSSCLSVFHGTQIHLIICISSLAKL